MNNLLQSVAIVVPIIFVLAFGFFAQRKKAFGDGSAPLQNLNELVLTFALPPALFVGTVSVSKASLIAEINLFFSLLATLLVAFFIGYAIAAVFFKRNKIESSIAGLAVSFSAGPFYGPALLGSLYGVDSGVAVSMISIAINVFIVPLATVIIKISLATQGGSGDQSMVGIVSKSLYQAIFKTPFVWAPLLAFIFVFIDLKMPEVVLNSLELIGKATAGVAVFVAGMTIAANSFKINFEVLLTSCLKNIMVPALFFVVAIYIFGMVPHTTSFNEGLLLAALPSGPMIVLLATRYKQYQEQASSILAVTTVGMLVTVTGLILLINP